MLSILGMGLGALAMREGYTAFVRRRRDRRDGFQEAQARAQALGVPLIVVGDPDSGFITKFFGRDYGCGDVCTDIVGCGACPQQIKGALEDVLPRLPKNSHVIYVSCTLEYVSDLPHCIRELERVAVERGLFVVRVDPTHFTTFWFYPGARWVLYEAPLGDGGDWLFRPFVSRVRLRGGD